MQIRSVAGGRGGDPGDPGAGPSNLGPGGPGGTGAQPGPTPQFKPEPRMMAPGSATIGSVRGGASVLRASGGA